MSRMSPEAVIDRGSSDRAGVLIALIGVGGAGKSSGVKAASERLAMDGVSITSFHTRSEFAALADDVLAQGDEPLTLDEKLVLMAFERVRELRFELEPIRRAFDVVLADRYWHCLAARAFADGVTHRCLRMVSALGRLAPRPDAILWLDVDTVIAIERIEARGEWRASVEYGERLRTGYARLARGRRIQRVDASASPAVVRDQIVDHAQRVLATRR